MPPARSAGLDRYRRLLLPAGARSAFVLGTVARLPIGMTALALLLLVQSETGSIARGSLVSAVYSGVLALAAPLRGSEVDRRGARSVLLVYGAAHPLALLATLGAVLAGLALPWVLGAAALAGATFPPVGALVRALWTVLYDGADLTTAYALDAVLVEASFIGGPLLVGVAVAVGHPALAVAASAGLLAAGALLLGGSAVAGRLAPRPRADRAPLRAPLTAPRVRRLLVAIVVLGLAFGATEVAVAAYALEDGARALPGLLLAAWGVGSVLGGLVYGSRDRGDAQRQYPVLVGLLAGGLALPLLAVDPVSLAALLVVGGAAIAPFSACNTALLARAAPAGAGTATFAFSGSAIVGGIAVGTALGGWLVEHAGARAGFALAAAAGLVALATALTGRAPHGRRTRRPGSRPPDERP